MYSGLYTGVQLILSYNHKKHDKASRIWLSLTQQSLSQKAPEEKFGNTQPLSVKIQTQSKIYNSHIPVLKNRHLLGSLWMTSLQSGEKSSCRLTCLCSVLRRHLFTHFCSLVRSCCAVLSELVMQNFLVSFSAVLQNFQVTKCDVTRPAGRQDCGRRADAGEARRGRVGV